MDLRAALLLIYDIAWIAVLVVRDLALEVFNWLYAPALKDIRGRTVLVTGSASGLGRELSLQLSGHGCRLVLVDVNQQANEQVAEEARARGSPEVRSFTCDISDRDSVMRLAKEAPPVEILINNAGVISPFALPGDIQTENIRKLIDVNLMSQFWMVQAFLPGMLDRDRGHILVTASIAGLMSLPKAITYTASKHAVVGFMSALRDELRSEGRKNIKTTVVCPYFLKTPFIADNFDMRVEPVPLEEMAAVIIDDGIRREKVKIVYPGFFLILSSLRDLFPVCVQDRVREYMRCTMTVPPHEVADEMAFSKRPKAAAISQAH